MNFSIGLDWASQTHAVCVLEATGQVGWQGTVEHSAAGLAELLRRLARFGPPAALPVALERPSGLLVDTLL
ncbi:MAG: IS110 family transposase, partial [Candidatus Rokuibacteriota bacterium]